MNRFEDWRPAEISSGDICRIRGTKIRVSATSTSMVLIFIDGKKNLHVQNVRLVAIKMKKCYAKFEKNLSG